MVGLSLLTLVPNVVGGSETYARELARALARVGTREYTAFVPAIAPDAADGLPARIVERYRGGTSTAARLGAMTRAALRPGPIRREFERAGVDALHFPLTVMIPPVERPPAATTILDLQHEEHPEFFGRAELAYRRVVYGRTIRRSRILITISEHARARLIERHGVEPGRVRTIHLAVDHERFSPDGTPRGDYLLYPARPWRHKNHARLFEAFAQLRREHAELRLVLTGDGDYGTLPRGVETRGHVSADELAILYRGAAALVYPSLYEGFGIPVVEAMACGCPVACSDVTSLPEVAGGAARLFDPRDVDAIAAGVDEVLRFPEQWVERGLARAGDFTWDACARAHDAVYGELEAA